MRRLSDVESEAECTEAKRQRGSKSAGADRSLCPSAQTKTHVSISLSVAFCSRWQTHPVPVLRRRCSKTRSHDPCYSCTPHRGSASQLQSHMQPWHRWHASTRCTHRRRARMKCNPNEHLCACRCATQAGACMQPACQRQLHGSGHATHTAITEQWPASRILSPACLSTHGTLAWVRWVRVPTGCVRIPGGAPWGATARILLNLR